MNICKSDIYFIILLALFLILFYKIYKLENIKEGFDATSDMKAVINQVYNADIEAIRNLSSIATQLTTNNTLTMPGALNITNELSVKTGDPGKQVKIGSSQIKFRGDGIVHYGLTNDKDGKFKISNLSGSADIGSGFVNDCITTDPTGNTTINGNLNIGGGITTGAITSRDWFRVKDDNGFYFQDRGGGWNMTDTTWIRSYGGKNVYCNAEIRANRMSTEGSMVIEGDLYVKGNIVLDGDNKWIFHTPDDGRKQLYIAPWTNGGWHWAHQAVFNP
jgi:hypothetical protein